MPYLDTFALAVMTKGMRFEIKSEKDAITLLLMLVRDGSVSVTSALECFTFEIAAPESFTFDGSGDANGG